MPDALLDRLASGSRIALIRIRSLGDCVLTTPAISVLKQHRPDLKLDVIVEPRFSAIFEGNPDIDRILPDITRQPRPADLVLNLHGGTSSMLMALRSGARFRTGFGHHRYSFIYSDRIPRAQEILGDERPVHTAEHVASAMFWLGVPRKEIPRAKLVPPRPLAAGAPYCVIHPFASAPGKTWPADRFVALARWLRDAAGLEPVFISGPGEDISAFSEFRVMANPPLRESIQLLSGAAFFAGNDSGPAHIAAAFAVPSLVLFGTSNPLQWAPWRTESEVLHAPSGSAAIALDAALAAADRLLARTGIISREIAAARMSSQESTVGG